MVSKNSIIQLIFPRELFSFGDDPYLGFSNSEASEKIIGGYRLPKPDDCSSEIYALMTKCWSEAAKDRPTMKEIHSKLSEETTGNQQSFLAFVDMPAKEKKQEEVIYHM
jgi:hypothetical protein